MRGWNNHEDRNQNMAENPNSPPEEKPKRSRASKPKVKTGCQTCKIRRVKCDETKPSCLRCVRFGHRCDGYVQKTQLKYDTGAGTRPLVPKTPTQVLPEHPLSPTILPETSTPMKRPASLPVFQNEQEYNHFQTFCSRISEHFPTSVQREQWTRLMFHACETSTPVKTAVVGLGSLALSIPPLLPNYTKEFENSRHRSTLQQAGNLTFILQREIEGSQHEIPTTLLGILLFNTFSRHQDPSTPQIYAGLRTIRQWTTAYCTSTLQFPNEAAISSIAIRIPHEHVQQALQSLELHIMQYTDSKDAEMHASQIRFGWNIIDDMPASFHELEEARRALELVVRRSMLRLRSSLGLRSMLSEDNGIEKAGSQKMVFDVSPERGELAAILDEYRKWEEAFRPLFLRAKTLAGADTIPLTSTLRMLWLAGYSTTSSAISNAAAKSDSKSNPLWEELASLSRLMQETHLNSKGGDERQFWFDLETLIPLAVVSWEYRHRILKDQAVALLLRSPRREGACDGVLLAKVLDWLGGLEEGIETGDTDKELLTEGLKNVQISFDAGRREARVSCQKSGVIKDVVIPW